MGKERSGHISTDNKIVLTEENQVVSIVQGKTHEEAVKILENWRNHTYGLLTE